MVLIQLDFNGKFSCNRLIKTFRNNDNSNDFTIIQLHCIFCYDVLILFPVFGVHGRHRNVNSGK